MVRSRFSVQCLFKLGPALTYNASLRAVHIHTVRFRGMGTGISEASKRVPIFSFATPGGKQVSSHFSEGN